MIMQIPWLVLPVLAYVGVAVTGNSFDTTIIQVQMISGAAWTYTLADLLLSVTLIILFIEILKATRTGGNSVVDHALSLIVFIACLILFLIWGPAGTSLFFLITLVTLIDVMAGFSVTIRGARRDFTYGAEGH